MVQAPNRTSHPRGARGPLISRRWGEPSTASRISSGALLAAIALATAGCDVPPGDEVTETTSALASASAAPRAFVDVTLDGLGASASLSQTRIDLSANNAFFHDFGTNGRTCGTCHHESLGWSLTPEFARRQPVNAPLFAFDGSDCLPPGVANLNSVASSTQMLSKALFRIDLPIPATADFVLDAAIDPIGCPTPPDASDLRMYRRPLPSANTAFVTTVMWDGRENVNPPNNTIALLRADLAHQSNDATRGHAQGTFDLSPAQQSSIVGFETGIMNAQETLGLLPLSLLGGHGGTRVLVNDVLPGFFVGINDVFSPTFTSKTFTLYTAWEPGAHPPTPLAASIGRGEALFNDRTFAIDDVRGINSVDPDDLDPVATTFTGACGTCHDTPNIGNHSVALPIDIGLTAVHPVGGLDVARLPTYRFRQLSTGKTIELTDGGRGLISGRFKDLGKTKGPNLRALATRAPFFHNGSAKDLQTVVSFYDARFHIGFTAAEKADLVAFLSAL